MFTANKAFSTFDRPQKPFGFVCVNRVLDIFSVRNKLKVVQSVMGAVKIFVVNFHAFGDRAYKRLPHRAVYSNLGVFPVFAGAKPNIMIAGYMRFNRPKLAISAPSSTAFNVKRGCDAGAQKIRHFRQRSAFGKHSFSFRNLVARKTFSSRHSAHVRTVADFVKALVAANRFPYLHAVDIKPVYVGGQA